MNSNLALRVFSQGTMKRKGIDKRIEKISKWDKIIQEFSYLTILNPRKGQQREINRILLKKNKYFFNIFHNLRVQIFR